MANTKTLCGYRRLSVDRFGIKIGLGVQTEAGELWAANNGQTIGHWYEDTDTAADPDNVVREEYEQMLRDVDAGMWGGVVCFRIDRLVRMSEEFERCRKIARLSGGFIVAALENLRTDDQQQTNMLRMQVMFAENEIVGMKVRIKANKQTRSKGGKYSGGGVRPYGFEAPVHDESGEKVLNSGRVGVEHVPREIENLRDAARRIAHDGQEYSEVIKDWHSRTPPVYGATGKPWTTKTLQTILTSPRMIGKQIFREEGAPDREVDAVWEPVLDEATYRILLAKVKRADHKAKNHKYLCTGKIFCHCGYPLTGATRKYLKGGEVVSTKTYRCRSGLADKARGACGKLSVIADPVDKLVVAHIFARLLRTKAIVGAVVTDESPITERLAATEGERGVVEQELVELAEYKDQVKMGFREYAALREPIALRLEALVRLTDSLASQLSVPYPKGREWDDLPGWWMALTSAQRGKLMNVHIGRIDVSAPGRSGRHFRKERVEITPADAK